MLSRGASRALRAASRGLHLSRSALAVYKDTNMPLTLDGRTHHLDVKEGDVANRVVTVGSLGRAQLLAGMLDSEGGVMERASDRGFVTFTGTFESVPMTVIATGMGVAMMDFMVREARAVVDGPMAVVRFGSCGSLRADVPEGSVVLASDGAIMVSRDPHMLRRGHPFPYHFSDLVRQDPRLDYELTTELEDSLGDDRVFRGLNVTACSFYSSQGRTTKSFNDSNEDFMEYLERWHPHATVMEMETFHLLDLAEMSNGSMRAASAVITLANRKTDKVLDHDSFKAIERKGGEAILRALARCQF